MGFKLCILQHLQCAWSIISFSTKLCYDTLIQCACLV
ncbi:hypothetical protein GLYMA_14G185351v4 [Glycine max]|nr:hypothetical protein GLYMA_14G185351v4 [Glycine max]KAH1095183.1 hypothetical protein GYH30_040468 [Glycine max]